jgi:hypothetical protein
VPLLQKENFYSASGNRIFDGSLVCVVVCHRLCFLSADPAATDLHSAAVLAVVGILLLIVLITDLKYMIIPRLCGGGFGFIGACI